MTTNEKIEFIIKKAVEGGYSFTLDWDDLWNDSHFVFMGKDFWVSIGVAMGWNGNLNNADWSFGTGNKDTWLITAESFHETNLTQGFDASVDELYELIK